MAAISRGAIRVHGHHRTHHRHVIPHILGEQGTDGAVNHTGGEDSLIGRTAFPLQKGTGDFSHGVQFFLKIHGKREKVHTLPGFGGRGYRHVYHGIPVAHETGTIGQLGDFSGLDFQRAAAKSVSKTL